MTACTTRAWRSRQLVLAGTRSPLGRRPRRRTCRAARPWTRSRRRFARTGRRRFSAPGRTEEVPQTRLRRPAETRRARRQLELTRGPRSTPQEVEDHGKERYRQQPADSSTRRPAVRAGPGRARGARRLPDRDAACPLLEARAVVRPEAARRWRRKASSWTRRRASAACSRSATNSAAGDTRPTSARRPGSTSTGTEMPRHAARSPSVSPCS